MDQTKLTRNIEYFLELVPSKFYSPSFNLEIYHDLCKDEANKVHSYDYAKVKEEFMQHYADNGKIPLNILTAAGIATINPTWNFIPCPSIAGPYFKAGSMENDEYDIQLWFSAIETNVGSLQLKRNNNWRAITAYNLNKQGFELCDLTLDQ